MLTRAEIQALIDAAPDGRIGIHQAGRPVVSVPYGMHVLDGPLVIEKRIDLTFNGGILVVPDGTVALHVKPPAWCARVRDVCVAGQSQVGSQHGAAGIRVEAWGAEVRDVLVRWVGTGVHIPASAQSGSNANGVRLDGVTIFNCDAGFHIKGGDTNGGWFAGTKIDSCRVGILDESFLGNTFAGTMLHTITEHAYKCTATANYSTIAGTYMELDCGSALPGGVKDTIVDQLGQAWIGGAAVAFAKVADRVGYGSTRLRFGESASDGTRYTVRIPDAVAEAALTAQRMKASGALIDGLRLRWNQLLKSVGLEAFAPPGGNGSIRPIGWTGIGHASGFGHARANAQPSQQGNPAGYEVPKP